MDISPFQLYRGEGTTIVQRGIRLGSTERPASLDDPKRYLASAGLRDAVNVAIAIDAPLLLTGEPGTGKSKLAGSLAYELDIPLVEFQAKTTSTARDLFYRYDALRHFHAANFSKDVVPAMTDYIEFAALGQAILLSQSRSAERDLFLPEDLRKHENTRSVVLIDEVDKAPRDLPNDVLVELEEMRFTLKETNVEYRARSEHRPVVVMTSNSEKLLPDAFLRRCVFYHIGFPDNATLESIVRLRMGETRFTPQAVGGVIAYFEQIRALPLMKKPSTAEFLQWLRVLERLQIDGADLEAAKPHDLETSFATIAKTKADRDRILDWHRSGKK